MRGTVLAAAIAGFALAAGAPARAQTSGPGVAGDLDAVSYEDIRAGLSDPMRWLT
jgi:hypothetical protein